MSSFISDKISTLNTQVDNIFKPEDTAAFGNAYTTIAPPSPFPSPPLSPSPLHTTATQPNIPKTDEATLALWDALQKLNSSLASTHPPAVELLADLLARARGALHGDGEERCENEKRFGASAAELVAASRDDSGLRRLEWLFLTRCSVATYALVLERLLSSTIPLAEEIAYWEEVRSSVLWCTIYALQTTPLRIHALGSNLFRRVSKFPNRDPWKSLTLLMRHPKRLLFSSSLFAPKLLLKIPTRNLSVLGFIRREISHRLGRLDAFRTHQAACLGLLADRGFQLSDNDTTKIPMQLAKSLEMMRATLEQSEKFARVDADAVIDAGVEEADVLDVSEVEATTASPLTISAAYNRIDQLLGLLPVHTQCAKQISRTYGRPPAIVRYWMPVVFGYAGLSLGIRRLWGARVDLKQWGEEVVKTGYDFFIHWVVKPWRDVWETVRHRENRLAVAGAKSLESDSESLGRMVANFAAGNAPNGHLDESTRNAIIEGVRNGDMTAVLKRYEEDIRNPMKNALFGSLIQALLIQVQKAKVDVDLTMAALDKLLRSNELNFAFLAAFPALFVFLGTVRWIYGVWQRRSHIGERRAFAEIIVTLRKVTRSLNRANMPSSSGQFVSHLPYRDQGILLCQVHLLRSHARYLPRGFPWSSRGGGFGGKGGELEEGFIEDLRDLENTGLSIAQKLETARRMYTEGLVTMTRR